MFCYRKMLTIYSTQRIINVEVERRLGVTVDIYQRVKLNSFLRVQNEQQKTDRQFVKIMEDPNKPARPRREWLDDVKKHSVIWIFIIPLEQRWTENCGQQLWEQQWTPKDFSPLIIRTRSNKLFYTSKK